MAPRAVSIPAADGTAAPGVIGTVNASAQAVTITVPERPGRDFGRLVVVEP